MTTTANGKGTTQSFLSDVTELRRRAREHMDKGAITENYGLDPKVAIDLLQTALATEIVCVLRYTMHAVAATGIASDGPKEEFVQHADGINQLGGTPNFDPKGLAKRSASEYGESELTLVDMIRENLVAERIAIDHYRELVRFFGDKDSTTRVMLEGILAMEEEHANDMHDLLHAHGSSPAKPV